MPPGNFHFEPAADSRREPKRNPPRRDATAEAIKVLVDAGVLTADQDIEQFVRTSYGLPTRQIAQEATA